VDLAGEALMTSSFAADLDKFASKTRIKADTVVRKVTLDLFGEVVQRTPVDTGMARANWQIGINERPTGTVNGTNWKQNMGHSMTQSSGQIKAGGVNYITNNLPYIIKLEYGSSKQAPQGMARITVSKFQEIVNRIVGGLK
jgi:hypothetical protein